LSSLNNTSGDTGERTALVHREILQLGVLVIVAVAAFAITRAVAMNNRDMSLRDAAEWYRRGQQQIEGGSLDDAIDSFRRATVRNRGERRYVLVLARALTLKRDYEAARAALLTLRESVPDDPDINLQLARLAVARQDVTEALRFYHSALYAPWPLDQADAQRRVRVELIKFLLAHNQVNRALSELLALSTDLPDDAAQRLEVAQLFATAGDPAKALDQFQRVLRLSPEHREALAGAGEAAFHLGNYPLARTYLRRAPAEVDDVRTTLELVDSVLSNDPLAARLGTAERRRRLIADFSYAQQRLNTCLEQRADTQASDERVAVQAEAQAFADQLQPKRILDQDTVEAGVDLIYRTERRVAQRCGPLSAPDQALLLIGRQHGGDAR
jgi:tetratricopeptide (TPR) repeat protein